MNLLSVLPVITTGLGLLSGSKQPTGTSASRGSTQLLASTLGKLQKYDYQKAAEDAIGVSNKEVQRISELALGNVMSKFSVQGSRSDLPDSARDSILARVLRDINNNAVQWNVQTRLNALPQFVDMVSRLVGTMSSGRGEQLPKPNTTGLASNFISAFGNLAKEEGWRL